jgi:hypothetical protein
MVWVNSFVTDVTSEAILAKDLIFYGVLYNYSTWIQLLTDLLTY